MRNGEHKTYYPNGQLCTHCYHVNDERHGEYKTYYSNGQLSEHCYYVNDKLHGEYKDYYGNGQLDMDCYYVNGNKLDIDLDNLTDEAKFMISLVYGGQWLC